MNLVELVAVLASMPLIYWAGLIVLYLVVVKIGKRAKKE